MAAVVEEQDLMSDDLDVVPLATGERERLEDLARSLAHAVDVKGGYDPSHCLGVARTARLIAHGLGVRGDALFRIWLAGLLHDVGKLQVPDHILLKPGRLTREEMRVVERHPIEAHKMLGALGLDDEARWVLHHHERGDGTGYPTRLAGVSIPLGSRILLVADAYDVMRSRRVYQPARDHHAAIAELRACEGGQFDPTIVDALIAVRP